MDVSKIRMKGRPGGPLPWVSAKTAPASFDMQVPLAANATVPVLPEGFPPPCMYSDTPCLTWQQRPSWRETKFAELRAPHVCDLISRGWDALWHANWVTLRQSGSVVLRSIGMSKESTASPESCEG